MGRSVPNFEKCSLLWFQNGLNFLEAPARQSYFNMSVNIHPKYGAFCIIGYRNDQSVIRIHRTDHRSKGTIFVVVDSGRVGIA